MRKCSFILAVLMVFIIPYAIFSMVDCDQESENVRSASANNTYRQIIRVLNGEKIIEVDLEDYVAAVVTGEMPSSFEIEALKAQAVATRTYTLRMIETGNKHSDADLCTDPSCCQAFQQITDNSVSNRVMEAVADTRGEVLFYDEELIEATYFSCSGGRTEAAVEVWGRDVPYLQAQDSPGEENAAHYTECLIISSEEFRSRLGAAGEIDFNSVIRTEGGGVKTLTIGGEEYTGTQLRELLDLRSTAFDISYTDKGVLITTRGYGHRVGMSQYGAEAMAVSGKTYDEILAYYYPGTERRTLTQKELSRVFDKAGNL